MYLEVDAEFSSVGMCAKHDGCDHTLWCLHRPEQAQLFGAHQLKDRTGDAVGRSIGRRSPLKCAVIFEHQLDRGLTDWSAPYSFVGFSVLIVSRKK